MAVAPLQVEQEASHPQRPVASKKVLGLQVVQVVALVQVAQVAWQAEQTPAFE